MNIRSLVKSILGLSIATAFVANAQTARLQVIHNAADPAAASVDLYVNGTLWKDDVAFRAATAFEDVPANTLLNIGVAPGSSTSVNDTLANFPVTLMGGEAYVAIANGVLNPGSFAANPDGQSTAFNIWIKSMAREAGSGGNVEFFAVHGATDAPGVDVTARGVATLVDNAIYGDITGYIPVPPASYILDVTDSTGAVTVASFVADLSGLADGAAAVFASGFLTPSANQNGPAFGLFAALANGTVVEFPVAQARLQVIHNAADPAAASVDLYVNGTLWKDDVAFRAATAFEDVPANTLLNIGVAPGSSTSVNDTLANFPVTLMGGEAYVAIANGVLNPGSFAANPDGQSTAFNIWIKSMAREAGSGGNVEFFAVHGATDAPGVDVTARGVATLVDNAIYGDITGYIPVPPASYILDVTDSTGAVTVASFVADLSGLADGAAAVFASGFLTPSANQNGPAFGLFAALANGTVVEFPVAQARLQVIHNAADPAAASVDLYVNGTLWKDDVAFRAATAFEDVPANTLLNIGVAPGSSTSVNDTLANFPVTLMGGEAYVAIANGVLNPGSFAANPDGQSTAFNIWIKSMAREAGSGGNVEFFAVHGATDAPGVDVTARGVATLVDNAIYGDITGYIPVPPASYILDVTDSTGAVTVASFVADLSGLADGAAAVFASGFLTPSANQNGPAFGLFAALANGTVVEFPVAQARLQVIHNAADPAAASVDLYVNGTLWKDDVAFRAATAFEDVPANTLLNIGVAPGSSTSVNDTLANFPVTLMGGEAYVAIANGVLNPGSFAANPDGQSTAFNIWIKSMAREAGSGGNVEFFAVHGATDAPGVDVTARGVATLVDNAIYGDITGYIPVPPASYILDVTDSTGAVTVASFVADLSGLADGAAAVFASGFLTPSANQNGPAFGLFAALANGTVVEFPAEVTSVTELSSLVPKEFDLEQNYPNPFNPTTEIVFSLPTEQFTRLIVYNSLGQEVAKLAEETFNAGVYRLTFDAAGLPSGTYFYRIEAGSFSTTKKMMLLK